jgi:ABC-2 type transport system ATP-binding protein
MNQPIIRTSGLVKRYRDIQAVDGLDLAVGQGEIFGFLGPNGAGKTTTCRILTTLTKPTAGQAWVSGHDVVKEATAAKRGMGVAPQHTNIDPDLTVEENLKLHAKLHGLHRSHARERIDTLLAFTGLIQRRKTMAKVLSGGLKRRLLIARAMLHEPRVLFMDEPTVGLDAASRRDLWELIQKSRKTGVTVFLTTHYIEEAEHLCDRVGIIDQGRLIALGTPAELLAKTGRVVVQIGGPGGDTAFFDDRLTAADYAAEQKGDVLIRSANLEDIFIQLTGRKVMS